MRDIKLKLIELEIENLKIAVELCDKIIDILPKFNGKQANKRLDTALKNISRNISFKTSYNSFIITLYKEKRSIDCGNHWTYLNDSNIYIAHESIESSSGDGICQNGFIDSETLIKAIKRNKEYFNKMVEKLTFEVENIDSIQHNYDNIQAQKEMFKEKTSYMTREYFNFKL